jgi:uncharacterized membrane protein YgcG
LLGDEMLTSDGLSPSKCPGKPDCYLLYAQSHYAAYNLTISYDQLNVYKNPRSHQALFALAHKWPSAIIVNFGVHYNAYGVLINELQRFRNDMADLKKAEDAAGVRKTAWFWLESFPGHFAQGYYSGAPPDTDLLDPHNAVYNAAGDLVRTLNPGLSCTPLENELKFLWEEDWRNRFVERVLPEFVRHDRILRIAHPLLPQWDAHVDYKDSLRVRGPGVRKDCTHYCQGSGVFRLVLSTLLSKLLGCLHTDADTDTDGGGAGGGAGAAAAGGADVGGGGASDSLPAGAEVKVKARASCANPIHRAV